jgi:hypothetical protein
MQVMALARIMQQKNEHLPSGSDKVEALATTTGA